MAMRGMMGLMEQIMAFKHQGFVLNTNRIDNLISKNPTPKLVNHLEPVNWQVPQPNVIKSNSNETYFTAYTKDNKSVYVSFDTKHLKRDTITTPTRTVDITVFERSQHFKSPVSSMECFIDGCPGTIHRRGDNWYGYCDEFSCQSIGFFFTPEPIQEHFINNDLYTIFLNIGMFGSGKTTMSAAKMFRHMLHVDRAFVLCVAQTLNQVIDVGYHEFIKFVPDVIIAKKTKYMVQLTNGSKIIFVASDKEDKIRGYNLTAGWGIEVNKLKPSFVNQLIQRIRNSNAVAYAKDANGQSIFEPDAKGIMRIKVLCSYQNIILESNPDAASSVINHYFTHANAFFSTTNVVDPRSYKSSMAHKQPGEDKIAVYSSTVDDNPYIPVNRANAMKALPAREYEMKVMCNLALKDGLVYDKAHLAICERFPIPKDWPRIFGADFGGGRHPTVLVAAAVDPKDYTCYVYDVYKHIDSAPVVHAPRMYAMVYGDVNALVPP